MYDNPTATVNDTFDKSRNMVATLYVFVVAVKNLSPDIPVEPVYPVGPVGPVVPVGPSIPSKLIL